MTIIDKLFGRKEIKEEIKEEPKTIIMDENLNTHNSSFYRAKAYEVYKEEFEERVAKKQFEENDVLILNQRILRNFIDELNFEKHDDIEFIGVYDKYNKRIRVKKIVKFNGNDFVVFYPRASLDEKHEKDVTRKTIKRTLNNAPRDYSLDKYGNNIGSRIIYDKTDYTYHKFDITFTHIAVLPACVFYATWEDNKQNACGWNK